MKINSTILSVLMLVAVVGCQDKSTENNGTILPELDSKEQVTINLNIKSASSSVTRATLAGVEGENEITDITVIAFDSDNKAEKIISQTETTVGVADVKTMEFKLSKGMKKIVAIVNTAGLTLPDGNAVGTYTLADLKAVMIEMGDNDASEIATKSAFKMYGLTNVNVVDGTDGNAQDINVNIQVNRLAAKVSVTIDAGAINEIMSNQFNVMDSRVVVTEPIILAAAVITTATETTLPKQAPEFALNQILNKLEVSVNTDAYSPATPTYFEKTPYKKSLATTPEAGTSYEQSIYCSKNYAGANSADVKPTMASVKLQIIPTSFISKIEKNVDGSFTTKYKTLVELEPVAPNDNAFDGDETYYGFTHDGKIYAPFYAQNAAVMAYAVLMGDDNINQIPAASGHKYENCINYYDVRIGDPTIVDGNQDGYYKVLSNNYYKIDVTKVLNFGIGEKTEIPEIHSDIIVSIEVLPWVLVEMNEDL